MNTTTLVVTTAVVTAAVAAAATAIVLTTMNQPPAGGYPTFRPGVKSATKLDLDACQPFPFTASKHPTHMFQIELTGTPLDVANLKPVITEMDVKAAPWTAGDPTTSKPYAGNISWTPSTPLDLDLNLAAPSSTVPSGYNEVLIRIVVDDPGVTLIGDPFTIISTDSNKKMFCKFPGGVDARSVTFVADYVKPVPNQKTFGSYSIGLNIPSLNKSILPIYLDPEVENNGFN